MTVQQSVTGITFGLASGTVTSGTFALTTSTSLGAFGFIPPQSDTINSVRFFLSSVAGTLAATDLSCAIYSDSPGTPGSSLGGVTLGTTLTSANNNTWQTFSGLSVAVTGGTQYWAVLSNANASPASNNARWAWIQQINNGPLNGFSSATRAYGGCGMSSTNGGTSWSNIGSGVCSWRIGFSSGAFLGFPASVYNFDSTACFGTNEAGAKFVLPGPGNLTYNIAGLAMPVTSVGTPTGSPLFRLYSGSGPTRTLLASTQAVVVTKALTNSSEWLYGYFTGTQQVAGGTTLSLTLADPSDVSSSNCYKVGGAYTVDSDANSLPLMPLADGGSQGVQKTALSGGSFADTNTTVLPFDLLFDSTGELTATGGGGGALLYYPGMAGGMVG